MSPSDGVGITDFTESERLLFNGEVRYSDSWNGRASLPMLIRHHQFILDEECQPREKNHDILKSNGREGLHVTAEE